MKRAMALLVVVLLAACSGGGRDEPAEEVTDSRESGADFCTIWWDRTSGLRGRWSETANADPVASLLLLIGAPGELARFFDRTAREAPDEIVDDLEALSEHFDRSVERSGEAVRDPLAFLVGGLASGAAVSGSFERVNDYVTTNCPVPAELAASASARTSAACQRVTATKVDESSSVDEFTEFLDDAEATGLEAAEPARKLRSAIRSLDPEARFGFEALGRLRFPGASKPRVDVDAAFRRLIAVTLQTCAVTGGTSAEELLEQVGPRPGLVVTDSLYGRCGTRRFLGPSSAIYTCDDHEEVVDLETGIIDVLERTPPATGGSGVLPDGSGAWQLDIVTHPAQGLEQPAWSATVSFVDYRKKNRQTVALVDHRSGSAPTEPNAPRFSVVYADPARIVTAERDPSDSGVSYLTVRTWDGAEIARHRGEGYEAFVSPVILDGPSVAFTGYRPSLLLDVTTGEAELRPDGFVRTHPTYCPDGDILTVDDDEVFRVSGTPAVLKSLGAPRGAAIGDGFLSSDQEGFAYIAADGSVKWTIPRTIATDIEVVFNWLVATNRSGAVVLVDRDTGREATSVSNETSRLVRRLHEDAGSYPDSEGRPSISSLELVDPSTDTVIFQDDGTSFSRHRLSDLCR